MRERREITACSHRTFLGDYRHDPSIIELAKLLDDFQANSAKSERENICSQQNHGAHLRLGQRLPNPASVTADQIQLQLTQLLRRNVNVGQFPESGADSVDNGTLRDDLFDHLARSIGSFMSGSADADGFVAIGYSANLSEGQCLAG